jgi:hypothetical protein
MENYRPRRRSQRSSKLVDGRFGAFGGDWRPALGLAEGFETLELATTRPVSTTKNPTTPKIAN